MTRVPPHHVAENGIARTFQNIELFEHATVIQNLLLGRHRIAPPKLLGELCSPACARAEARSARRSRT